FGRTGVRYLVGDACKAPEFLDHASFDIIVSFETVEHVADPVTFLHGLRTLAATNAGIFISCPNDYIAMPVDKANPFHLRKYTFEEFKGLAEMVLGNGDQWLLGANVQGYAFIPDGDSLISCPMQNWQSIVNAKAGGTTQILPSQWNVSPDKTNVLCYLGIWGVKDLVPAVTVSAQSYPAFIGPWETINWFKEQLANASELKTEDARQILKLEEDCRKLCVQAELSVAEARHRTMELSIQLDSLQAERHSFDLIATGYKNQALALEALAVYRDSQLSVIYNSKSWKWTKPVRVFGRLARGEFDSVRASLRQFLSR
ncbi:methyltransferase domain-containing protein, partial [Glaciimonas sp. CA11.2]